MQITIVNRGPDAAPLHVLPTVWFRNTWSWSLGAAKPELRARPPIGAVSALQAETQRYGMRYVCFEGRPPLLFTENETNTRRLYADPDGPACPKDAINDFLVQGATAADQRDGRRHQGGSALRDRRARGRRARDPRALLAHRAERERLCRLRVRARHAQGRSRRVLRHDHPGASLRRRSRRHATEPGRPAVEQAVLPLRRQDLAGRATRRSHRRRRAARATRATPSGRTCSTTT